MPVIKVWCLPADQATGELLRLHEAIVAAVVGVSELGLQDQNDMTVLFPSDLMLQSYGETLVIEINGLPAKPKRTPEVLSQLAERVGKGVKTVYPESMVECFVTTFEHWQGFWTSA